MTNYLLLFEEISEFFLIKKLKRDSSSNKGIPNVQDGYFESNEMIYSAVKNYMSKM